MSISPRLDAEVFLDAVYAIALASAVDHHHVAAVELADEVRRARTAVVTTHGVVFEIAAHFARGGRRVVGTALIRTLLADPAIHILPITHALFADAWALYMARPDKEWSLVDCVSFVVMRTRGLTQALTADAHFDQAGFAALLRPAGTP